MKLNNKTLLIVFGVLLGLYFLGTQLKGKQERSFKEELVRVDTAKVSSLLLYSKADGHKEVKFSRENGQWTVSQGELSSNVQPNFMPQLLNEFVSMKTKRVAGVSKANWEKYEVTDSLGSRIKILEGGKVKADLTVGKFDFKQPQQQGQQPTMSSFVRLTDEEKVYVVDGAISMAFSRGFEAFRDRTLATVNKANITKVTLEKDGQTTAYAKGQEGWQGIDSTAIDQYLTGLGNVQGSQFKDGFSPSTPLAKLTLEGNNMKTLELNCYPSDAAGKFVVNSSANPSVFFETDSVGVFKTVYLDLPK